MKNVYHNSNTNHNGKLTIPHNFNKLDYLLVHIKPMHLDWFSDFALFQIWPEVAHWAKHFGSPVLAASGPLVDSVHFIIQELSRICTASPLTHPGGWSAINNRQILTTDHLSISCERHLDDVCVISIEIRKLCDSWRFSTRAEIIGSSIKINSKWHRSKGNSKTYIYIYIWIYENPNLSLSLSIYIYIYTWKLKVIF